MHTCNRINGAIARGLLAAILSLSAALANAGSPDTPKDPELVERDFAVADGTLPGTLTLPHGPGPFPAVVLVHGSGPHDRDQTMGPNRPFRDLAHGLAKRGVAVLRYDKRTHARPLEFLGGEFTVEEEVVADAISAVTEAAHDTDIDAQRVFVLGHSLGAMLTPRIAARSRTAGMILLAAPARPLEDLVLDQLHHLDAHSTGNEAERKAMIDTMTIQRDQVRAFSDPKATGLMLGLPAAYWLDLRDYDPVQASLELSQPLMLIHGGRDYQVTGQDFERWKQAFAGHEQADLRYYDSLNHLMMSGEGPSLPVEYTRPGAVDTRVIDDIAHWITAR